MPVVLCPTRGGQSSVPNQEWAVTLAQEQEATLIFLYVSSVSFLNRAAAPVLVDLSHELDELGEFVLEMAKERAATRGVKALSIVRQGEFRQTLTEVIQENDVDTVVIGKSRMKTGVTSDEYLQDVADSLLIMGVTVFVVDEGRVVNRFPPSEDSF